MRSVADTSASRSVVIGMRLSPFSLTSSAGKLWASNELINSEVIIWRARSGLERLVFIFDLLLFPRLPVALIPAFAAILRV